MVFIGHNRLGTDEEVENIKWGRIVSVYVYVYDESVFLITLLNEGILKSVQNTR